MKMGNDLVSCLCVTKNKPQQLKRAIECFLNQTYKHKELLVIYESDNIETKELMRSIATDNIKFLEVDVDKRMPLGALRNLAIEKCRGEYFCQWDDDDWYHNCRIEVQLDAARANHKVASVMAYWFMYDTVNNKAFLSRTGPWPGTILCKKEVFERGIKYQAVAKGEDSSFLKELMRLNYAVPLIMPSLYLYSYHGNNTYGQHHFNDFFRTGQQLSRNVTELFRKIFSSEISNDDASYLLLQAGVLSEANYFFRVQI